MKIPSQLIKTTAVAVLFMQSCNANKAAPDPEKKPEKLTLQQIIERQFPNTYQDFRTEKRDDGRLSVNFKNKHIGREDLLFCEGLDVDSSRSLEPEEVHTVVMPTVNPDIYISINKDDTATVFKVALLDLKKANDEPSATATDLVEAFAKSASFIDSNVSKKGGLQPK